MIKPLRFFPALYGNLFQSRQPAHKQDYSWMNNDEMAEWEALRALERDLFAADPDSKTIFHHSV